MNRWSTIKHLGAAFAFLLAAIVIVIKTSLPERADYSGFLSEHSGFVAPEVGSSAPPFDLWTPSFEPISLESMSADVIILTFWATWCRPCREEMRELQALYEAHPASLRILAINLGETSDIVSDWVEDLGLSYDILLDPFQTVASRYQVRGGPTTYLLNADHKIMQLHFGPLNLEELARTIEGYLSQS